MYGGSFHEYAVDYLTSPINLHLFFCLIARHDIMQIFRLKHRFLAGMFKMKTEDILQFEVT